MLVTEKISNIYSYIRVYMKQELDHKFYTRMYVEIINKIQIGKTHCAVKLMSEPKQMDNQSRKQRMLIMKKKCDQ